MQAPVVMRDRKISTIPPEGTKFSIPGISKDICQILQGTSGYRGPFHCHRTKARQMARPTRRLARTGAEAHGYSPPPQVKPSIKLAVPDKASPMPTKSMARSFLDRIVGVQHMKHGLERCHSHSPFGNNLSQRHEEQCACCSNNRQRQAEPKDPAP